MTNLNIPIYRAKRVDSDEYVRGYLLDKDKIAAELDYDYENVGYAESTRVDFYKIDKSTLSIHFPDMIDGEGNKIFASLSEDGKGGDIIKDSNQLYNKGMPSFTPYYRKGSMKFDDIPSDYAGLSKLKFCEIIGIQE